MDEDAKLLFYFKFNDVPKQNQHIAESFNRLAYQITQEMPNSTEKTMALRKLLESRDCVLRIRR